MNINDLLIERKCVMFQFQVLNLAVVANEKCGTVGCIPDPCDPETGGVEAFQLTRSISIGGTGCPCHHNQYQESDDRE